MLKENKVRSGYHIGQWMTDVVSKQEFGEKVQVMIMDRGGEGEGLEEKRSILKRVCIM